MIFFDELQPSTCRALVIVPPNVLFRYENAQEKVILYAFHILKETPQGVWIDHWGKKKFVLKGDDGKRFGYRTREAALKSFVKRKNHHIGHLSYQLKNAESALRQVTGKTPEEVEAHAPEFQFHPVGRYYYGD